MADGGSIGIIGNELLTVNAAGNFTFSGVGSVVVPDGAWVGADAACSWVFDSTNGDVTTLDNVGIGETDPDSKLHVKTAGADFGITIEDTAGGGYAPLFLSPQTGSATIARWDDGHGVYPDLLTFDNSGSPDMVIDTSGNIGFGTLTIPHGAVGYAKFAFEGTDASGVAGPHIQVTTDADDYPLLQIVSWGHDNISIFFDSYYDGAIKSSDVGSNFQITKIGDELKFQYDSGIAQGAGAALNEGLVLDITGGITIPALGGLGNDDLFVDNNGKLINDPSDARFKSNIEAIGEDALAAICGLRGVSYDWNESVREIGDMGHRRQVGLIAQEVELYIPLAVTDSPKGYKTVSAKKIIPYLVEAIKAQQVQIEALQEAAIRH